MAHLEAEWLSQQNTLVFNCFLFHYVSFHDLQTQIRHNLRQKVFNLGTSFLCRGLDILKIYI